MMIFTADIATYDVIEGAHVAGLAIENGADSYLMFQRRIDADPDDWGIYVELHNQSNSGYQLVSECKINRDSIKVELNHTLAGTNTIFVKLAVNDEAFIKFTEGMKNIFRDYDNQLDIKA